MGNDELSENLIKNVEGRGGKVVNCNRCATLHKT